MTSNISRDLHSGNPPWEAMGEYSITSINQTINNELGQRHVKRSAQLE